MVTKDNNLKNFFSLVMGEGREESKNARLFDNE